MPAETTNSLDQIYRSNPYPSSFEVIQFSKDLGIETDRFRVNHKLSSNCHISINNLFILNTDVVQQSTQTWLEEGQTVSSLSIFQSAHRWRDAPCWIEESSVCPFLEFTHSSSATDIVKPGFVVNEEQINFTVRWWQKGRRNASIQNSQGRNSGPSERKCSYFTYSWTCTICRFVSCWARDIQFSTGKRKPWGNIF